MKKVLFISNIGLTKKTIPNGVNIKNRHILKYLNGMENVNISIVDTDKWKLRVIPLFFQIVWNSFRNEKIVLSINTNSAYQIVKFLNFMKLENKLIYIVVGGSLHNQIESGSLNIKYFNKIQKLFVQTKKMEKKLCQLGLKNVEHLSNSKYFEEIKVKYNRKIHLPIKCFYLGRIHPDKGTDMIFEALDEINKKGQKFQVDFFGPIEKSYEELFLEKIDKHSFAKYEGIIDLVDNANNYRKLSNYNLFLFPTYWHGEGFPGVVIDSFISGIPVLASDWNHNTEVIQDKYNGIIFKSKSLEDLVDKLNYIYKHNHILIEMGKNAHKSAKHYKTENVLKVLDRNIY
ncbi:MAG: glycosyltransferase [Halanaerobiales bacterium]